MAPRTVLITGASSGIGRACALHLHERGFHVYGTSRVGGADASPFAMLPMDVSDDASVQRAIHTITQREGRIDVVVNNAGIGIAGPLESTSIEEAQRLLDVNLLGALRVTRAVLPTMRRQQAGYIVTIGSIGGLIAIPYQSLYSASKFGLDGMMESLRMEVRPFGVRVVLIEPGDTRTPFPENRTLTADAATRDCYRWCPIALSRMVRDEQNGPGPEGVARRLHRIVNTQNPRLRYMTGPAVQRAAVWMKRLLPNAVLEYGMRKYYGLDS